jgi:glycosyltransferase involved in cell wall biosynthesis
VAHENRERHRRNALHPLGSYWGGALKLHTVFITYNRLDLTKRAIASYIETMNTPHFSYVVVDNSSTDGTREWLLKEGLQVHLLNENRYPGYSTNLGWSNLPKDATHLHRADNDFEFLPGWCDEVARMFENPRLGQLGLRTDEEEECNTNNVGGNCVISREIWDLGVRWDERPWPRLREEIGAGWTEDSLFSKEVRKTRVPWSSKKEFFIWDRAERQCIRNLATGDWHDPYYVESYGIRGIRPRRDDHTVPDDWTGGYST